MYANVSWVLASYSPWLLQHTRTRQRNAKVATQVVSLQLCSSPPLSTTSHIHTLRVFCTPDTVNRPQQHWSVRHLHSTQYPIHGHTLSSWGNDHRFCFVVRKKTNVADAIQTIPKNQKLIFGQVKCDWPHQCSVRGYFWDKNAIYT